MAGKSKNDIGETQYQPLWHYTEALDMAIKALRQADELEQENEFLKSMQRALTKEMSLEELGFILTMERRK